MRGLPPKNSQLIKPLKIISGNRKARASVSIARLGRSVPGRRSDDNELAKSWDWGRVGHSTGHSRRLADRHKMAEMVGTPGTHPGVSATGRTLCGSSRQG